MECQLTDKGKIFLKFFLRFLKENHCFGKYQRALFEAKNYRANNFIKRQCEDCNFEIINRSFTWSDTKEGDSYWRHLDNEFINLYYFLFRIELSKTSQPFILSKFNIF
jgi:hypothetical protein